jgi:penicillin V acylase-like amidase (Ntn superfamily)
MTSAIVVARTMDWPESTEPLLAAFPRGLSRDGGVAGPDRVDENGARWTSKFGSLVSTIYGIGSAGGLNERGLAATTSDQRTSFSQRASAP